jgi:hypothetical protein
MSPAAPSRRRRRAHPQVQRYQGYELRKIGSRTVTVSEAGDRIVFWCASWRQAQWLVRWLRGAS